MKKGIAVIAALGVLIGGAVVLNMGEEEVSLEVSAVRLPGDCPAENSPCDRGQFQRPGFCLCLSSLEEVPGEQKPEAIPVNERRRKVLRCNYSDPETGATSHVVRTEPITTPPGTAIILDPNVTIDASFTGFEGPLLKAVQAKCCQACPQNCWVSPGSWKACPQCLCDGTCGTYCPKKEEE